MNRILPGCMPVEGRECLYLACQDADSFKKTFCKIGPRDPKVLPASGGMINEEATIGLPDGRLFCGLSYKGDVEGWRRLVVEWCNDMGLLWGMIRGQSFILSNGEKYLLSDCQSNIG